MRFKVTFQIDSPLLPSDNRRIFISLFKQTFSAYSSTLYDKFYGNNSPNLKSFAFSLYFPNAKFKKNLMIFEGKIFTMTLSTYDLQDGMLMLNAFIAKKSQTFPLPNGNSITIKDVSITSLEEYSATKMKIKFLSPLVVSKQNKETNRHWFYELQEEGFEEVLKFNVESQLKNLAPDISIEGFELIPITPKTVSAKAFGLAFPALVGTYILKGNPQLLNFLYQSGMGKTRSAGFGLFEIIN